MPRLRPSVSGPTVVPTKRGEGAPGVQPQIRGSARNAVRSPRALWPLRRLGGVPALALGGQLAGDSLRGSRSARRRMRRQPSAAASWSRLSCGPSPTHSSSASPPSGMIELPLPPDIFDHPPGAAFGFSAACARKVMSAVAPSGRGSRGSWRRCRACGPAWARAPGSRGSPPSSTPRRWRRAAGGSSRAASRCRAGPPWSRGSTTIGPLSSSVPRPTMRPSTIFALPGRRGPLLALHVLHVAMGQDGEDRLRARAG